MGCTHALRGQDWIPSIPKLVLISEALDMPLPKFLHLPTIVGADRKKLSKRSGDASAIQLLEQGYIPEAILNFIALLGWNPKTNQEIMSLDELIAAFKIEDIHVSNAFFDKDKFNWMNGQHLQKLQADDYYSRLHTYLHRYQNEFFETVFKKQSESFNRAVALEIRSRMQKFEDFIGLTECFYSPFDLDPSLLLSEKMKVVDYTEAKHSLEWILQAIDSIPSESFELEVLKNTIIPRIAEAGLKNGQVLWPTRVALTSQAQSPGAFEMLAIL
jgi:glutamyl/glutaminyl-tRNA synthetase